MKSGGKTHFAQLKEEKLLSEKVGEFFQTFCNQGKTLRMRENEAHQMG
jgi:hypothetical protein